MNEKEKDVVTKMITIYCRSKHKSGNQLYTVCEDLNTYALQRLERCPFGEGKPTCGSCTIHCYKKDMRAKIKEVMRFSGIRLIIYNPIELVRHMLDI